MRKSLRKDNKDLHTSILSLVPEVDLHSVFTPLPSQGHSKCSEAECSFFSWTCSSAWFAWNSFELYGEWTVWPSLSSSRLDSQPGLWLMLGWKRASSSSSSSSREDKWVCCSITEGKQQGDCVSLSWITNRWQPHPRLVFTSRRMHSGESRIRVCSQDWRLPVERSVRDLITVSLAVLVSRLRIESSCSVLPLQPASLRSAPHKPQRTVLSHSLSWGWTIHAEGRGGDVFIFLMLRGK